MLDDELPDFLSNVGHDADAYKRAWFDEIVPWVLQHEGNSFVVNEEIGEVSKYGVSLAAYRDLCPKATATDIQRLTESQAKEFYFRYIWVAKKLYLIESKMVAAKLLDMAVHMGAATAIQLMQRAANKLLARIKTVTIPPRIQEDGVIGPQTVRAVKALLSFDLVREMAEEQKKYYKKLAGNDKYKPFLAGWLARAEDRPPLT